MIKLLLPVAVVFVVVYAICCFFQSLASRSEEEQITFYEAFFKHLGTFSVCLVITMGILSFIVINF